MPLLGNFTSQLFTAIAKVKGVLLKHTLNNPNAYDTPSDDAFGRQVAISGNYAIVSAGGEDAAGQGSAGKAYIFNVTTGALVHTLNNPSATGSAFGDDNVAISDNFAIIGEVFSDSANYGSGKAYIFNVTTGALVHTLNNPNAFGTGQYDWFGESVAISGNYAIVGAYGEDDGSESFAPTSGKAYIFNVTTGALVHTLNNPNPYGYTDDQFGNSVAISGNYAIVGAHYEDSAAGNRSGKAYIFNVTTGALVHTLNNPNAYLTETDDEFGYRVAMSGNYAIVGVYYEDYTNDPYTSSGVAYIYNVTTGALVHTLTNPNTYGTGRTNDSFGREVSISGNYAIVSAPREDFVSAVSRITVNESVPTNGITGLTLIYSGDIQNGSFFVDLPFSIQFLTYTYDDFYVGTGGYISFGYQAYANDPGGAGQANVPRATHLGFFKGNRRLLTLYGGVVDAGVYTLRWEGYTNYSGSSSDRTIVEIRLFQNSGAHQVRYIRNDNGETAIELANYSAQNTDPLLASESVTTPQGYNVDASSITYSDAGKAYIYNVTTGALVHTLDDPNAVRTPENDAFSNSVSISGNYAIAGAPGEYHAAPYTNSSSGKAYIYQLVSPETLASQQIYTGSAGGGVSTYTWICPAGVTSVSVVCVGGGGGGDAAGSNNGNNNSVRGGGGGGLGWKNSIAVTPGNSYTVQVGNGGASGPGGTSFFISSATVAGFGGQNPLSGGAGGSFTGDGGGAGGAGGTGVNPVSPTVGNPIQFGGGGGAGGYSGSGGTGGNASNGAGSVGSGGGGGGGGAWTNAGYTPTYGYGSSSGGGVGLNGIGSNGVGGLGATGPESGQGPTAGGGGSFGVAGIVAGGGGNPYGASGGQYGGGASSGGIGAPYQNGGAGAVRIIWQGLGTLRSFPNTGDV